MNAQLPQFNSSIISPPANFQGMFPEASHRSPEPAVRHDANPEGAGS